MLSTVYMYGGDKDDTCKEIYIKNTCTILLKEAQALLASWVLYKLQSVSITWEMPTVIAMALLVCKSMKSFNLLYVILGRVRNQYYWWQKPKFSLYFLFSEIWLLSATYSHKHRQKVTRGYLILFLWLYMSLKIMTSFIRPPVNGKIVSRNVQASIAGWLSLYRIGLLGWKDWRPRTSHHTWHDSLHWNFLQGTCNAKMRWKLIFRVALWHFWQALSMMYWLENHSLKSTETPPLSLL